MKNNNDIKVFDCTLRDGGYYNNWDFTVEFAERLTESLVNAGIDIIELGYKSKITKGFNGLFRFCNEDILTFLKKYPDVQFTFMINAQEFIVNGEIDTEGLDQIIRPVEKSYFSCCRIATHFATIQKTCMLVNHIKKKGYKVCLNLMGVSLLSEEEVAKALQLVEKSQVDVFFFADSFGSFHPEDITFYTKIIKKHFSGQIGFHAHDNQGLAFANVLTAISLGITYIDSTIMGMGRGAGNVKTEQLLLMLYFRKNMKALNPSALIDIIHNDFAPLMEKYHWGWDYSYMLSGLENIHPNYCQKLKTGKLFSIQQVSSIIEAIEVDQRKTFSPAALSHAMNKMFQHTIPKNTGNKPLKRYKATENKKVLIVGSGESVNNHKTALMEFIETHQPLVIECNHTGHLDELDSKKVAVLDVKRLREYLKTNQYTGKTEIITGHEMLDEELNIESVSGLPCKIEAKTFEANKNGVIIPLYLGGIFAISIALLSQPDTIFIAGFDGYKGKKNDDTYQDDMESFWQLISRDNLYQTCEFVSLTPTTYSHIEQSSVYAWLI